MESFITCLSRSRHENSVLITDGHTHELATCDINSISRCMAARAFDPQPASNTMAPFDGVQLAGRYLLYQTVAGFRRCMNDVYTR
jgi:hypothetical protein